MNEYKPAVLCLVEPKVSGDSVTCIYQKINFNKQVRIEAYGYSRGIWVFWKAQLLNLSVLNTDRHFIHCQVQVGSSIPQLLSLVYKSLEHSLRKKFWQQLNVANFNIQGPWLTIWNFNSVSSQDEIQGSVKYSDKRSTSFNK